MTRATRPILSLIVSLALVLAVTAPARGQLVSTSEALAIERAGGDRSTVDAYLAREEVAAELAALGVDPEVAALRAAALTPDELRELAGRIDDAPAGAGVIEILGITFLVLIVLEWVGVIDIFKKP